MVNGICFLRRQAFTLIEIMIVMVIILIIAALFLVGAGMLRESAEVMVTRQRLQNLSDRALALSGDDVRPLQELVTNQQRSWVSMRTVLAHLQTEHGLDLEQDFNYLPPGIWSIYDDQLGAYERYTDNRGRNTMRNRWKAWRDDKQVGITQRRLTIDNVISWAYLKNFTDDMGFEPINSSPPWTVHGAHERTFFWWHRREPAVKQGGKRWCRLYRRKSFLRESLDSTYEILPDGKYEPEWYLDQWPLLSETGDQDEPIQHAWPDSDWDQAQPGSVPPIWEAPFNGVLVSRITGDPIPDHSLIREQGGEVRSYADCSPLATLRLLQWLEVVPDADDYRQNRNRESEWNDKWGNPLIATAASFIAPRYGLDPAAANQASHGLDREFDDDLHAGRNYLQDRYRQFHGSEQSVYLGFGALGPVREEMGDDNPITNSVDGWVGTEAFQWDETYDAQVFRAAWLQIREVCEASEWRDGEEPAWSGTEKGEDADLLSLLTSMQEIK